MSQTVLSFGPPKGVRNTTEPYDDASTDDFCHDALNGYFRDPALLSGFQARPGAASYAPGGTVGPTGTQGIHGHVSTSGAVYNFYVTNGKLYRLSSDLSTGTDVTPGAPIAIDASNPVQMVSVGDSIIVTDGANKPWIMTAVSATPVTGTNIDIDGAGGTWSAISPTIYQGSVVLIPNKVPAGSSLNAYMCIVWSEPNQPSVGYTQSGYANFFNVIEQGVDLIGAIWGTNIGLFYWRPSSIGVLAGSLYNFSTTATRDARSTEVGTLYPNSIAQIQDNIFFADVLGRAWMLPLNGKPIAIWKQMSAIVQNPSNFFNNSNNSVPGAAVPELNLYTLAAYSTDLLHSPTYADMFDGVTGNYVGRWQISNSGSTALGIDAMGQIRTDIATAKFAVMGGDSGNAGDTLYVLTQVSENLWKDGVGAAQRVPSIFVETDRLGYAASVVYNADLANIVTMSSAPLTVTVTTPYTTSTVETTAEPPGASNDGTYRAVIGLDVMAARGIQVKITPTTADAQWGFQRIEAFASAQKAGPEDL